MQGILFEGYAVTWGSDFSKVIWLFGIEGKRKVAKPFKKVVLNQQEILLMSCH